MDTLLEGVPVPDRLDDAALDRIFRAARTHRAWEDRPLTSEQVRAIYELAKYGPTAGNSCPGRFVFLRSQSAKERLKPHLDPLNIEKTLSAPCCVIVAYDSAFYDFLPLLSPGRDRRSRFVSDPAFSQKTALRSSTLQGAYLIIAARALGLDCGPMSGFNNGSLDEDFFQDGRWKSNFLCNIGYRTVDVILPPRNPRLDFDEACREL